MGKGQDRFVRIFRRREESLGKHQRFASSHRGVIGDREAPCLIAGKSASAASKSFLARLSWPRICA